MDTLNRMKKRILILAIVVTGILVVAVMILMTAFAKEKTSDEPIHLNMYAPVPLYVEGVGTEEHLLKSDLIMKVRYSGVKECIARAGFEAEETVIYTVYTLDVLDIYIRVHMWKNKLMCISMAVKCHWKHI